MTKLNVRIAPSGPQADANDNPLAAIAGIFFKSRAVTNPDTTAYSGFIGALQDPKGASDEAWFDRVGPGVPVVTKPIGASASTLVALNDDADFQEFKIGVGRWLVEAEIAIGFTTRNPTAANYGALEFNFIAVTDSGVPTINAQPTNQHSVLTALGVGTPAEHARPVKSAVYRSILTITQENLDVSNGGKPFNAFSLYIRRVNPLSGNTFLNNYAANSGELAFTTDTSVKISRLG